MKNISLLGAQIGTFNRSELVKEMKFALLKQAPSQLVKINTEFLEKASSDVVFRDTLNRSDIPIADGVGVLWAAKYLTLPISDKMVIRFIQAVCQMIYTGIAIMFNRCYIRYPIPEVYPGLDAFNLMLEVAMEKNAGIFIFGSSQDVLMKSVDNIKKDFPGLKISGFLNGYDFQKDHNINPINIINKTNAKLLFVALGSPKQEYWIAENLYKLKNIKIAVGEGGTLDRIAYPSQKSPKFINKIGLEWLWRLLFNKSKTETRNRFQRFWNSVPVFIFKVVRWKIVHGATEIN